MTSEVHNVTSREGHEKRLARRLVVAQNSVGRIETDERFAQRAARSTTD